MVNDAHPCPPRVRLTSAGLLLDEAPLPLLAGSVHYWRLEPQRWTPCLQAVRALGLGLVDLYIPWSVHEAGPGQLDFGAGDPQRDVVAFLRLVHDAGLRAIVRPGPHVNAELTYFGLPERIVWDRACQARSPRGNPVMLPVPPKAFPVPSHASETYLDEAARYLEHVGRILAPLRYPDGPIVLLQVDNEGALFFRDGPYDQDYHPDARAKYRDFLRHKYETVAALPGGYGQPRAFADVVPPTRFDAERPEQVAPHLDWMEFQEQLIAGALERFAAALAAGGLDGIPTVHNFPVAEYATPLNAALVSRAVDLVGLDYYYRASPASRATIARRTGELALRCEGRGLVAYSCEMGAGIAPYFAPLRERDNAFTVLAALAYGLRGFNVYMAVERDRWIGAPIDSSGQSRPSAQFWRELCAALVQIEFFRLRRRVPVRLVVPRTDRRLARAMHAFGPASGAMFAVLGARTRDCCAEDDLGLGYPLLVDADGFVSSLERALDRLGVPFAVVGGEDHAVSLDGAAWIICATSGAVDGRLLDRLARAQRAGVRVTVGPRAPRFDDTMSPLGPEALARVDDGWELWSGTDPDAIEAAVARVADELRLARLPCEPPGVYASWHENERGELRVVFVINAEEDDTVARLVVGTDCPELTDVLSGTRAEPHGGVLRVPIEGHSVRMLAVC